MMNNEIKISYVCRCNKVDCSIYLYVTVKEENLYIDKCTKYVCTFKVLLLVIIVSLLCVVTNKPELGWVYKSLIK